MSDIISDAGPPKKKETPEPKGDKAIPEAWAQRARVRRYRNAMRFAGFALDAEITEAEFKKALAEFQKLPGNWYKKIAPKDLKDAAMHPEKYMKKVVK
jgi:hypothetical protein